MQLDQIMYLEDFTCICQLQYFICHHSIYSPSFAGHSWSSLAFLQLILYYA